MKKTKQIKIFGSIALLLITLLGTFFVILPTFNETNTLVENRTNIEEGNTELDNRIAELEKDRTNVQKITNIYLELVKRFPTSIESTNLLADVSNAATLAGMSPSNIEGIVMSKPEFITNKTTNEEETTETSPSQNLAVMEVNITVNGTPNQLTAFLGSMNEVNRVVKISSVNVSTRGTEGISSMSIVGTTYIYQGVAIPDRTINTNDNNPAEPNPTSPTPVTPENPDVAETQN
jgi:Tfp pilus assembly protein PilO